MPPEDIDMEYQEQMNDEERELEEEMKDWVKVVHCKECKWYGLNGCAVKVSDDSDKPKDDDYCSFGERIYDNN